MKKWADIPHQAKEKMWVIKNLENKYKDYRKDSKDKYYSPLNTDEERLEHPPPNITAL